MNNSTYNISLDIHETSSQVSLNVKKGDNARIICAVLTENGKPYRIADGVTATFKANKPKETSEGSRENVFGYTTIKDNKILCQILSGYTNAAGIVNCEFNLVGADSKTITSPRFNIIVDDTVYDDSDITANAEDKISALQQATYNANAATIRANEAADDAKDVANEAAKYATDVANEIKQTAESGGFDGKPGAVFTPYVDNNGNLSWSNNGNLKNPSTQNIKGPRGDKGDNGHTPYIGDNLHWWINGIDTGKTAVGQHGQTPYVGKNGNWWVGGQDTGNYSRGADGHSPYIDEDGYWVIMGNYKTDIPATGPQGEPGKDAVAKTWVPIDNRTLTETIAIYEKKPDKKYTEVFVECELVIATEATSPKTLYIRIGREEGKDLIPVGVSSSISSVSNGDTIYYRANGRITPSGKFMFDMAASKAKNTATLTRNCTASDFFDADKNPINYFDEIKIWTSVSREYWLGAGSTINIWGR